MITRIILMLVCFIGLDCQALTKVMPDECPGASTLKSMPFTQVYYSPETRRYQPYAIDTYDTNERWLFAVFVDDIKSEEEALALANEYLSSLYGKPVPVQDGKGGYTCLYMTAYGFAFSVTPPALDNIHHQFARI